MSEEEYASSHFVGSDSDATFRMLEEEDELPDDMTSQAREAEPKMTMSKKIAPTLNFPSDHPRGMNLDGTDLVLSSEEIPSELLRDGINRKVLAAARKAVADYSLKPCHVCDD